MIERLPYLFVLVCSVAAGVMNSRQGAPPKTKAPLSFDAVSIKLHDPAQPLVQFQYLPAGFHVEGALTTVLLMQAYQIRLWDIVGGPSPNYPSWISDDRFDITAKADHQVTRDEIREMMRTMLADRFHLQVHHEMKAATCTPSW